MKTTAFRAICVILGLSCITMAVATDVADFKKVTFVCEHCVAKSILAAAYFNKLPDERGLKLRAVARGVLPELVLQPATVAGLAKDGVDVVGMMPKKVDVEDNDSSLRIVTIDVKNEPEYLRTGKLIEWDGAPPVSKNYEAARDEIVKRINVLFADLATAKN